MTLEATRWDAAADGEPSEQALRHRLEQLGYSVQRYLYPPGTYFAEHIHHVDKIDAVVSGHFRLTLDRRTIVLGPGDWIAVPRGVPHNAAVIGEEPAICLDAVRPPE